MIKIYTFEEVDGNIAEDSWDFPFEEIDYLLKEHNGESFTILDGRLWEVE